MLACRPVHGRFCVRSVSGLLMLWVSENRMLGHLGAVYAAIRWRSYRTVAWFAFVFLDAGTCQVVQWTGYES